MVLNKIRGVHDRTLLILISYYTETEPLMGG